MDLMISKQFTFIVPARFHSLHFELLSVGLRDGCIQNHLLKNFEPLGNFYNWLGSLKRTGRFAESITQPHDAGVFNQNNDAVSLNVVIGVWCGSFTISRSCYTIYQTHTANLL